MMFARAPSDSPTTSPVHRAYSAIAVTGTGVVLVGGENATHVLSDVWLLRPGTSRWQALVEVGSPMAPLLMVGAVSTA